MQESRVVNTRGLISVKHKMENTPTRRGWYFHRWEYVEKENGSRDANGMSERSMAGVKR